MRRGDLALIPSNSFTGSRTILNHIMFCKHLPSTDSSVVLTSDKHLTVAIVNKENIIRLHQYKHRWLGGLFVCSVPMFNHSPVDQPVIRLINRKPG